MAVVTSTPPAGWYFVQRMAGFAHTCFVFQAYRWVSICLLSTLLLVSGVPRDKLNGLDTALNGVDTAMTTNSHHLQGRRVAVP
jgi:hypothetical protein